MTAGVAWKIVKESVSEFTEDNVRRLAAALAYSAMFSLGPLLVIVIAVAGLFFEKGAVTNEVQQQVQSFVGEKAAGTVSSMLSAQKHESSVIATILGTLALLFGASGVFGELQSSLNTIWEVQPKPGQGIWGFIRTRFLSFAMVLGIAFLLLVSLVITAGLEAMSGAICHIVPMPDAAAKALHLVSRLS
jgi:membrane protein